jgi:hypothetical protein
VLIRSVIENEVGDHTDATRMRRIEKMFEIFDRSVIRQNLIVVRDVITAVA